MTRREYTAWTEKRWQKDTRDVAARRFWEHVLDDQPSFLEGLQFRHLWGPEVARAFRGVAMSLGLPSEVGSRHAEMAMEQLDLVALGMHRDLAARVAETAGDPIRSLVGLLDSDHRARMFAFIRQRSAWESARSLMGLSTDAGPDQVAMGSDLAVFLRLVAALEQGAGLRGERGLPGWSLVAANRCRMRGRLRALVADDALALRRCLLGLDGLYARTASAVGRHAWEWAWREARVGFGFDADRMRPAACTFAEDGPAEVVVEPIAAASEPAVLTFLLAMLGRGCWDALERWLQGAPGRTLGGTFYRHLSTVPRELRDSQDGGSYRRLWDHLSDGGTDAYLPRLYAVARRVTLVPISRDLKTALHEALLPDWSETHLCLPQHHLPTFRQSFHRFLARQEEAAARPGSSRQAPRSTLPKGECP